jgi:hypothetical protein
VREICTLRARRRGLETESRVTLAGHEGANPGYRQGRSYGPPRQFLTQPAWAWPSIWTGDFQRSGRSAPQPADVTLAGEQGVGSAQAYCAIDCKKTPLMVLSAIVNAAAGGSMGADETRYRSLAELVDGFDARVLRHRPDRVSGGRSPTAVMVHR